MDCMNLGGLLALSLPTLDGIIGTLSAIAGLGLVIFLHEFGHFAVAKWCNVHVERFSIGFGPIILGWKWGETEYALSAIPFGGYVKMLGQDDADPSQMTSEEIAADPRSYIAKNVPQRMAIISAGVTMNVITAVLFYVLAFGMGVDSVPPTIGVVSPGLPAWQAGVRRGDVIEKLNGRSVTSFQDLALHVAVSDGDIVLEGVRKDGTEKFKTTVSPDFSGTRPQIGIRPSRGLTVGESPDKPKTPEPVTQADSAASRAQPPFEYGDELIKVGGTDVSSFAQFQDLLASRNGEATTITVKRDGAAAPIDITVDTNYFRTLGIRLDAAPITAIQKGSPAEAAGLEIGDKFAKINGRNIGTDIDPLRLPNELALLHGQTVEIIVSRQNPKGGRMDVQKTLVPDNRPGWLDAPENEGEPISIPAIGVAFHAIPVILQVDPEGPAAQAGIPVGAEIHSVTFIKPEEKEAEKGPTEVILRDKNKPEKANNWGFIFSALQRLPGYHLKLTILEKDQTEPRTVTVIPVDDTTWPSPQIGLMMQVQLQQEKATGFSDACSMGAHRAWNTVLNIYLTLKSLVTGRLSHKELHGPLGIAQAAYESARMGLVPFLLFLGFLSLNLAVLNFLPIPVLDGGHMVFLLYEGLTRRRPSEKIMVGSLYVGLAFLLGLMVLVLYLDIGRLLTTPK